MGREWIPIDLDLENKPEVLQIMEEADCGPEIAVYRLFRLWGWFSLNSADGTAKATPTRLARVCGGDAEFWRIVERTGWLQFDESAQTATIPQWHLRFSGAAKARAVDATRKNRQRIANVRSVSEKCPNPSGHDLDKRPKNVQPDRDQIREEDNPSSSSLPVCESVEPDRGPATAEPGAPDAAAVWPEFLAAWNAGRGVRFHARMPAAFRERLADPEWLAVARRAIAALPQCRYFRTPVNLPQFLAEGFADDVLAGKYANARVSAAPPKLGLQDAAPPREFTGDDAARFEATRQRELQKLREAAAG